MIGILLSVILANTTCFELVKSIDSLLAISFPFIEKINKMVAYPGLAKIIACLATALAVVKVQYPFFYTSYCHYSNRNSAFLTFSCVILMIGILLSVILANAMGFKCVKSAAPL